jgi:hypothetical protein
MLITDQPEQTYYVVVLRERIEPTQEQFYEDTYKKFPGLDSLWKRVEGDRQRDYREAVLKELRKEAGLIDDSGNPTYEVDAEFRKTIEGKGREE